MPAVTESRYLVQADWDSSAPHLDAKTKREMLASYSPLTREARSSGIPALGSGAIYPIPRSDIQIPPFLIPTHYPRGFALDVGWKKTAAIWGAWDRETDILYAYAEYYVGHREPSNHAAALRARGQWIPGVIDPAGTSQSDGERLRDEYIDAGANIVGLAEKAVEAGIDAVYERLMTGRLKIFSTLGNFWSEYFKYRRDEKGKVVKENDHLMDALRYLVMGYQKFFIVQPVAERIIPGLTAADTTAGY